jgi:tetratricopeptide (TPR) repeat protein
VSGFGESIAFGRLHRFSVLAGFIFVQDATMTDRNLVAALRLLGQLEPVLARGDRAPTNAIIAELIVLRAPMGEQWQRLAQLLQRGGEFDLARQAIDLFVEAFGGTPAALYQKAALLAEIGAWNEGYALLCSLPENVPDPAANAYSRGIAALNFGDFDEARVRFEQVTQLRPLAGSGWLALARSVNLAREEQVADRITAAMRGMAEASPAERAPYGYALGKMHADRGDHQRAFNAFRQGAQQMKALLPYDRAADQHEAEQATLGYSPERIAEIARRQEQPTARTIFVTGLPRSGTTLVQQILASHSQVSGGGEIDRLTILAREMGHAYPALRRAVIAQGVEASAALWHHWINQLFPARGRVIDKTLSATRFLGLVAALLPEAPLVWLRRDPLDCAWSCYRTFFYGTLPWSVDLDDIAFHFRLEDQLLAQWQSILGERLLIVPYEALVADHEPWIRRLLAHCGLNEEPGPFAPHENRSVVTTASATQVRRPINREGVGAAAPYRRFLEPFVAAYGL